jgi:hypothetical protein
MAVSSAWRDVMIGFMAIEWPIGGSSGLPLAREFTIEIGSVDSR